MTRQKLEMSGYSSSLSSGRSKIIIGVVVVIILALVIAVAVLASSKDSDDGPRNSQDQSSGLKAPGCSLHSDSSNLERAKCVLDSYPLIDG